MGTSFQVVLAAGTSSAGVHDALDTAGRGATVIPIGEQRWAVLPSKGDDGYAETDDLARLCSRPPGAVAAAIQVFGSDVLAAGLFRAGRHYHDYLSDQAYLMEHRDDDGNEILIDLLGRPYLSSDTPPTGPYGADPGAFLPLAAPGATSSEVAAVLTATTERADEQFRRLLLALRLEPFNAAT